MTLSDAFKDATNKNMFKDDKETENKIQYHSEKIVLDYNTSKIVTQTDTNNICYVANRNGAGDADPSMFAQDTIDMLSDFCKVRGLDFFAYHQAACNRDMQLIALGEEISEPPMAGIRIYNYGSGRELSVDELNDRQNDCETLFVFEGMQKELEKTPDVTKEKKEEEKQSLKEKFYHRLRQAEEIQPEVKKPDHDIEPDY